VLSPPNRTPVSLPVEKVSFFNGCICLHHSWIQIPRLTLVSLFLLAQDSDSITYYPIGLPVIALFARCQNMLALRYLFVTLPPFTLGILYDCRGPLL
jgi:hypothetical protein